MRILYVGNGAYKNRASTYYDSGRKLCNGFTRNSHNVYFLSDRDTSRAGNIFKSSKLGVGYCNEVFIDICKNFQPEMIVFVHADIIKNESLENAKSLLPDVKMVQINVDALFTQKHMENIRCKIPYLDATFVTTAGSVLGTLGESKGVVSYLPNPVDESIETLRCHEYSNQKNDVFWAGRFNPETDLCKENPRFEFPLFLEKTGNVKIDYYGMKGKPPLVGATYYQAIGMAKMGLNINQGNLLGDYIEIPGHNSAYLYSSDRIAQYMGSGLLVFCYRDKNMDSKLEELFEEDKEMVFFSSREELLDKILYYKKNDEERKEIARGGWEKSHYQLNERLVAKYVIEVTFKLPLSEDYIWPTELY